MDLFLTILLFAVGVVLIVKGGDFFVDAATWIAEVSGIPKVIVGATVVSLATTLPEIIVSVIAALGGKTEMAIGNAVGSVVANTGLILAISMVCLPFAIRRRDYGPKSLIMIASAALLIVFTLGGSLGTIGSVALIVLCGVFFYENIAAARDHIGAAERVEFRKNDLWLNLIKFFGGAAGIVIGANFLVENGSKLASTLGVPESVIAATLVAVGTSLPELVTTIIAITKKQGALSVGNILGANIIDMTLILPICSLISGKSLPMSRQGMILDLPACLVVFVIAIVPMLAKSKTMRWQGITLLAIYGLYLATMLGMQNLGLL